MTSVNSKAAWSTCKILSQKKKWGKKEEGSIEPEEQTEHAVHHMRVHYEAAVYEPQSEPLLVTECSGT